jgi:Homeodomain-like domain
MDVPKGGEEIGMNKRYVVRLTAQERAALQRLVSVGKASARKILHARILLQADQGPDGPGWKDEQIAEGLTAHPRTVANVRQRLVEGGLEAALDRKKQAHPSRQVKLDGQGEAHLIALRCGPPPAGRMRWTLRLLADKLVALDVVDSVSHETVRRVLKKTS